MNTDPLRHAALEAAKALEPFAGDDGPVPHHWDAVCEVHDPNLCLPCRAAAARTALLAELAREPVDEAKRERQRIRAILWSLPMLHLEAPDEQAQRRITLFVARVDELISELKPLPTEVAERVQQWQAGPILCPAAPVSEGGAK